MDRDKIIRKLDKLKAEHPEQKIIVETPQCQFCCSKCYEDYDGELPEGYCDNCDPMDI